MIIFLNEINDIFLSFAHWYTLEPLIEAVLTSTTIYVLEQT